MQILIGCHGNTNKMALACLVVDWVQGDHLVHLCVTMAAVKEKEASFAEDPIDLRKQSDAPRNYLFHDL